MKITVTDIIAMFPIAPANMPTIGTDQQPPTHHSIKTFKDKLYSQAIAIPTQEGDTTLGHIYQWNTLRFPTPTGHSQYQTAQV